MTKFTLGLIQMKCSRQPAESMAKAVEMLRAAAKQGVQVALLPELFLTDYFCQREDQECFKLAEPIPGPSTEVLSQIARETGMVIVGSLFEKRAPGICHNTIVMIEKDGGIRGLYRKMHIPHDPLFYEKYYFTPGDLGFKAIDTSAGKIGTLICWDQWYPEAARLTAMQGAELLVYPTAIAWITAEKKEWGDTLVDAWQTSMRGHAIANGVYVAACNRIGREDALEFWGHSFICDPYGRIIAQGSQDKEEIITAEIDPAMIEHMRLNWPFFRDRRIDAYGGIIERWPDGR